MEKNMKPTKEQIEAVAEWWAVRTFDKAFNQNNGDDSPNGDMAFMLMNLVAHTAKEKTGVEARGKFKEEIVAHLLSVDGESHRYDLDVDYHPNTELHDICINSNVDTGMLPCKTFTFWDRTNLKFKGRYQYGGKFEEI